MATLQALTSSIESVLEEFLESIDIAHGELCITVEPSNLLTVAKELKKHPALKFEQLVDLCGVDYLHYGKDEWTTENATGTGFERAVRRLDNKPSPHWTGKRFAVVYHFLSVTHNHRLRLKVFVSEAQPIVDSVAELWASANWAEREAYDLYGILFAGHPDLRRILTDYGFVGHPFRKDFPLEGKVEVRYDATLERVIYDKVDIESRTLVPKVIRDDNRYIEDEAQV
ncbi:MAG: NADH-quinone oxidoreductase subunit C [Legionellales bacterium]|nr:NADH-quinone oxidoreductase subunit C [Legionellales bacterium]|tara:strand:- start:167 stop:847 length:681 start_codon:yes stop_codon:yes gene_type:complete